MKSVSFEFTLQDIALHIDAKIQGDSDSLITGLASLRDATDTDLSFIVSKKYLNELVQTDAKAIIMSASMLSHWHGNALIVDDAYFACAQAAGLFEDRRLPEHSIHPSVVIGKNCSIADSAIVYANVVIGDNCTIGTNSTIKENVSIGKDVRIGNDCIIHQGAVIGCDGFGNVKQQGKWFKIPQLGGVSIANNVEIGANTTIDCGTLGDTVIEDGVRIDNLVQVAHNVRIGANTAIAAQTGIAGSARIGKDCMLAGQVGIVGQISICDNVVLTGKTIVTNSIKKPGVYSSGTGLMENSIWRKVVARLKKLDDLHRNVRKINKELF